MANEFERLGKKIRRDCRDFSSTLVSVRHESREGFERIRARIEALEALEPGGDPERRRAGLGELRGAVESLARRQEEIHASMAEGVARIQQTLEGGLQILGRNYDAFLKGFEAVEQIKSRLDVLERRVGEHGAQ